MQRVKLTVDVALSSGYERLGRYRSLAVVARGRGSRHLEGDRDLSLLGSARETDGVREEVDDDLTETNRVGEEDVLAIRVAQLALEVESDVDSCKG